MVQVKRLVQPFVSSAFSADCVAYMPEVVVIDVLIYRGGAIIFPSWQTDYRFIVLYRIHISLFK